MLNRTDDDDQVPPRLCRSAWKLARKATDYLECNSRADTSPMYKRSLNVSRAAPHRPNASWTRLLVQRGSSLWRSRNPRRVCTTFKLSTWKRTLRRACRTLKARSHKLPARSWPGTPLNPYLIDTCVQVYIVPVQCVPDISDFTNEWWLYESKKMSSKFIRCNRKFWDIRLFFLCWYLLFWTVYRCPISMFEDLKNTDNLT